MAPVLLVAANRATSSKVSKASRASVATKVTAPVQATATMEASMVVSVVLEATREVRKVISSRDSSSKVANTAASMVMEDSEIVADMGTTMAVVAGVAIMGIESMIGEDGDGGKGGEALMDLY